MCAYITHVRICYICSQHDTVLITENLCRVAKQTGVFGSCGRGSSSEESQTAHQCWKCKERVRRILDEKRSIKRVVLR